MTRWLFATELAACALLGGLACSPAHASISTLSYAGYSIVSGQDVILGGSILGGATERASAGQIELQHIDGGSQSLYTFCVDVQQWLQPSGQFTAGTYLKGPFATELDALLTHVLPTISANTNASAALQVAIWEAEYGNRLQVSGNDAVTTLASFYLNKVSSGQWRSDPTYSVALLDGGNTTQSQIILARVPEPVSTSMLGVGLFGLAVLSRRRNQRREERMRREADEAKRAFDPFGSYKPD